MLMNYHSFKVEISVRNISRFILVVHIHVLKPLLTESPRDTTQFPANKGFRLPV